MKYILITGAASGIGKMIAETMARRNWTVFATDLNKEMLSNMKSKNIIPIYMDITNEKTIIEAYRVVAKETLYLDVVLNCAGIGLMSSLIEEDVKKIEKVMDINLFGMIRVNKIFFPIIPKETGRIINISSECGWMSPAPFNAPYIMSKYAVEAYNDSLRRELNILGIKVIKIQPGSFKTAMHKHTVDNFKELVESTKHYKSELKLMSKMMRKELKNANNPKYLMNAVVDACESQKPKLCYRVKNSPSMTLINLLPEKTIDNVYLKSLS